MKYSEEDLGNGIRRQTVEYLGSGSSRETFTGPSEPELRKYAIKYVRDLAFWRLQSIQSKFLPDKQMWEVVVVRARPSQMESYSHKPLFWRGGR